MKRPAIHLITHNLTDLYGQLLLSGVADSAHDHHADLFCFVGRDLNSPRQYDAQSNIVYQLAAQKKVDGLIYSGGIVSNFTPRKQVESFFRIYPDIPKVSIAVELKNVVSVLIDNVESMKKLLRHLVEDHGCRRIAYITGPGENMEVYQRFKAYCEVLLNHQIPLDPNLVVEGDFEAPSGELAVQTLLDDRKMKFDALVAANDNMAAGALEALIRRGVRVPHDIAVAGFDDFGASAITTPPMTTIRQPIYEMARKAVELLMDQIGGKKIHTQQTLFPTELVIRESCGCFPFSKMSTTRMSVIHSAVVGDIRKLTQKNFMSQLLKELRKEFSVPELNRLDMLIKALVKDLYDASSSEFVRALNSHLQSSIFRAETRLDWQSKITIIQKYLNVLISDRSLLIRISEMMDQARSLISHTAERLSRQEKARLLKEFHLIREASESLMMSFDFDTMTEILEENLAHLGVKGCYLALYEEPVIGEAGHIPSPAPVARLKFALNGQIRYRSRGKGFRFRSSELVPGKFRDTGHPAALIVEPLYTRYEHFGFIVFEPSPVISGLTLEALRAQISNALKGASLAGRLSVAQQCIREQAGDVETARQELEQFAYIVSHDLQEPLRMVTSYGGLLERKTASTLDPDARDFLSYMTDGARRMQTLLHGLLQYARITSRASSFETIPLKAAADRAITSLQDRIRDRKGLISVGRLPSVHGDPAQLELIFFNLLDNSLKFSKKKPVIQIAARKRKDAWIIDIRDNGIGIDKMYHEQIFSVFQRLHHRDQYSGTGMGLAVCKKIVERHGGRIWVESAKHKGSLFRFTLPVR
ncbi:substrate-binding domain-containing protein [bacterium]|nr:substrate-binding domain-containing protein [bacterium]